MADAAPNPTPPGPGPRPLWIPSGLRFDTLPPPLQQAITDFVDPIYEELVLEAGNALKRSMGLTHVHLLWLELIEMLDLGKELGQTLPRGEGTDPHQEKIGPHLRLVAQKGKVAKFLLDVDKFHERAGEDDPLRRLLR